MHPDAERNAEATARLMDLLARLTEADLERSVGGGWTVAMALGHLAFWDRLQTAQLRLIASGAPPAEDTAAVTSVTNEAVEPLLAVAAPLAVGSLAVTAAELVDEAVNHLDGGTLARLLEGELAYLVRRWMHREEHIEQIAAALAS
jgi:DinB superfamily